MDPSKSGTIILLKYLIYNTPSHRAATVVNLTEIILLLSRIQSSRHSYCLVLIIKKEKADYQKGNRLPSIMSIGVTLHNNSTLHCYTEIIGLILRHNLADYIRIIYFILQFMFITLLSKFINPDLFYFHAFIHAVISI